VAGFGVLGTLVGSLGGVLITQRRSDKRDEKAWQREREREGDRWRREDQVRTFENRRSAYQELYEQLHLDTRAVLDLVNQQSVDDESLDLLIRDHPVTRLDVLLSRLEMYGTEGTARAARTAIESYVDLMISGKGAMPRSIEGHDADMLAFREAMRLSLGIESYEPMAQLNPES
jgi:hypothetical protein